jgi:hypothetical protein
MRIRTSVVPTILRVMEVVIRRPATAINKLRWVPREVVPGVLLCDLIKSDYQKYPKCNKVRFQQSWADGEWEDVAKGKFNRVCVACSNTDCLRVLMVFLMYILVYQRVVKRSMRPVERRIFQNPKNCNMQKNLEKGGVFFNTISVRHRIEDPI